MTQEEKELLTKDLCARLPYKPRVRYYYSIGAVAINGYYDEDYLSYQNLEDFSIYPKYGLEKTRIYNILPYLRPMSSMTEEEREEERKLWDIITKTRNDLHYLYTDFLLSHHLDFRGLIPMGLALEAPKDMYNII